MPGGWSFALDPVTNDLIDDGRGSFVRTYRADTHVQLQLQCYGGECWQDEQLGSLLHRPQRFATNPLVLVPSELERALGVLQGRGLIDSVKVTAQQTTETRVDLQVTFRDIATGQVVNQFLAAGD